MTKIVKLPKDLDYLIPYAVNDLIRIGRNHDGGYIVPKSLVMQSTALLSLGLGDDWSFDEHWRLLKPTDPIHIYDGEVWGGWTSQLQAQYDKFWTGLSIHYSHHIKQGDFIQSVNKLNSDKIFLKMDIEGGEYAILDEILSQHDKIIGITMEIHDCNGERARFSRAVKQIQQYYKIVHLHGNTYAGDTLNDEPAFLTDALELTFSRNDLCASETFRYDVHLPELDFSNCENFEDIKYYFNK